ncbi:hypothetical protein LY78DRAFT_338916 [Colletotrichum sublineola]|nr:hypothetical protein LY78DRAFT_338916 [Colletotrichum sublineola]
MAAMHDQLCCRHMLPNSCTSVRSVGGVLSLFVDGLGVLAWPVCVAWLLASRVAICIALHCCSSLLFQWASLDYHAALHNTTGM